MTIAEYLTHNAYEEHVNKIIALYNTQATAMLNAIEKYFPKEVRYTKPQGGMFIWATLPEGISALELFEASMAADVAFVPGDPFYTHPNNVNTLRLNYTNATEEIIEEGIQRLGNIMKQFIEEKQKATVEA